ALRAHLPLLKSKFPPAKLRNGPLFGQITPKCYLPFADGRRSWQRALLQESAYGFVAQIVCAATNRLSPTYSVPRRLPQFSQPFGPRARKRNCTPIHYHDLRGLRDKWSRGCEKSDDRIVGCRLTSSSRPRDRSCEQFFGRCWSPAAVNFQN